ncbi:Putative helicase MOV-10 [Psilocybe cubensis]|uniref:Helicase MOV-10 n=1 Tax=Psilocybe cubensis TaxID=181762 RepID=A0ACB8GTI6_PSICU|nr:Putative helicase MOV-10 [Psilocybe cubensis]KAH9478891.1 Putative helicase MOV-10 [Psilocybe cubensis]
MPVSVSTFPSVYCGKIFERGVALTRAQALLIVVGNPTVLSLDPLWRSFLNYIHSCGGWRGKEINWDPKEPVFSDGLYNATRKSQAEAELEDTIAKLCAMVIQKHEDDGFEIDDEDDKDQDAAAFERPILREAE